MIIIHNRESRILRNKVKFFFIDPTEFRSVDYFRCLYLPNTTCLRIFFRIFQSIDRIFLLVCFFVKKNIKNERITWIIWQFSWKIWKHRRCRNSNVFSSNIFMKHIPAVSVRVYRYLCVFHYVHTFCADRFANGEQRAHTYNVSGSLSYKTSFRYRHFIIIYFSVYSGSISSRFSISAWSLFLFVDLKIRARFSLLRKGLKKYLPAWTCSNIYIQGVRKVAL